MNEVGDYNGAKAGSVTSVRGGPEDRHADAARGRVDRRQRSVPRAARFTGKVVAVANYSGGNFAALPVAPGWEAGPLYRAARRHRFRPGQAAPAGPARHEVVFDPSNRYLLEVDDLMHAVCFRKRREEVAISIADTAIAAKGTRDEGQNSHLRRNARRRPDFGFLA